MSGICKISPSLDKYVETTHIHAASNQPQFDGAKEVILSSFCLPKESCNGYDTCQLFLQKTLTEGATPKDLGQLLKDSLEHPALDAIIPLKNLDVTNPDAHVFKNCYHQIESVIFRTLEKIRNQYNLSCMGAHLRHGHFLQAIILRRDSVIFFNPGSSSNSTKDDPFCVTYSIEEAQNFFKSFHHLIPDHYVITPFILKSQTAVCNIWVGATHVVHGSPRSLKRFSSNVYADYHCRLFLEDKWNGRFPKNHADLDLWIEKGIELVDLQGGDRVLPGQLGLAPNPTTLHFTDSSIRAVLNSLAQRKEELRHNSIGAVLESHGDSTKTHGVLIRDKELLMHGILIRSRSSLITIFYPGLVEKQSDEQDAPFCATFSSMEYAILFLSQRFASVPPSYDMQLYTQKAPNQLPKTQLYAEAIDGLKEIQSIIPSGNLSHASRLLADLQVQIPVTIGQEKHSCSVGALVLYHLTMLFVNANSSDSRLEESDFGIKAFTKTKGYESTDEQLVRALKRTKVDVSLARFIEAFRNNDPKLAGDIAAKIRRSTYLNLDTLDDIQEIHDFDTAVRSVEEPIKHAEEVSAKLKKKWGLV